MAHMRLKFVLLATFVIGIARATPRECVVVADLTKTMASSNTGQLALAGTEHESGKLIAAEARLRRLITVLEAEKPIDSKGLGLTFAKLSAVRYDQGVFEEAEAFNRRGLALIGSSFGPEHGAYGAELGFSAVILCATAGARKRKSC